MEHTCQMPSSGSGIFVEGERKIVRVSQRPWISGNQCLLGTTEQLHYELTVVVIACIRPVQAYGRPNSSMESGVVHEILPLALELLIIVSC